MFCLANNMKALLSIGSFAFMLIECQTQLPRSSNYTQVMLLLNYVIGVDFYFSRGSRGNFLGYCNYCGFCKKKNISLKYPAKY